MNKTISNLSDLHDFLNERIIAPGYPSGYVRGHWTDHPGDELWAGQVSEFTVRIPNGPQMQGNCENVYVMYTGPEDEHDE